MTSPLKHLDPWTLKGSPRETSYDSQMLQIQILDPPQITLAQMEDLISDVFAGKT